VVAALIVVVLFTAERPGVLSDTPWSCPATHPIKGYASEEDALRDGSRPSRSPSPRWPNDDLT
jgi:hypothetical protein